MKTLILHFLFITNLAFAQSAYEIQSDELNLANIGLLKGMNQSGETSQCTATVIAPRLILTAAHCLFSNDDEIFEKLEFYPNYNSSDKSHSRIKVINSFYKKGTIGSDIKSDIALLELQSSLKVYIPLATQTDEFGPITIVGYPDIVSVQNAWLSECYIDERQGPALLYDCPTAPGMSGAPILKMNNNGRYALVGIHIGKRTDDQINIGLGNLKVILNGLINGPTLF